MVDALLGAPFTVASTWSDDATAGTALRATIPAAMPEAALAASRTPALRGVAETAPYMHSGQVATLADVVEFYDRGGDTPAAGTKELQPLKPDRDSEGRSRDLPRGTDGRSSPPALLVDASL